MYKYGKKSNAAFRESVAFSACKVPLKQLFERSVSCLLNFDSYPLPPYFYSGSKKNPTCIPINPHNRTYKLINVIRILKLCWRPVGDIRLFFTVWSGCCRLTHSLFPFYSYIFLKIFPTWWKTSHNQ